MKKLKTLLNKQAENLARIEVEQMTAAERIAKAIAEVFGVGAA